MEDIVLIARDWDNRVHTSPSPSISLYFLISTFSSLLSTFSSLISTFSFLISTFSSLISHFFFPTRK